MNETPTIKLTGHFNKTFSVKKEEKGYKGLEYSIEWDFDKEQTRIPISTHGATKLADTFRKLGFTQVNRKIMKKTYRIPCSWEVESIMKVEAESWDEAISIAGNDRLPLPTDSSYVCSSFKIDQEMLEYEQEKQLKP